MNVHQNRKQEMKDHHEKGLVPFLKLMAEKINNMFRPEEVEVTFKTDGKNATYTYIKVDEKQVA